MLEKVIIENTKRFQPQQNNFLGMKINDCHYSPELALSKLSDEVAAITILFLCRKLRCYTV